MNTTQTGQFATIDVQGVRVPALGLGTWMLTGDACVEGVADALALGYRHIDTAQMYENEAQVGEGLQRAGVAREQIFLTTKLDPANYRRDDVTRSVRESLERLGTEYVDLLLIHWPSEDVPLEETLEGMQELKEAGMVRHLGVSNFPPSWVERAIKAAGEREIFCNQVEYHPFLAQHRLVEMSQREGFLLTAYCPLARGKVAENETLRAIGAMHEKSAAQVTLRWLLQQGVAAIPKAAKSKHRKANLDVFDFELSDEEMERIFTLGRDERLIDPEWGPRWER